MKGSCLPVAEVPEGIRRAMFALLERWFTGVSWDLFRSDLEAKDGVVILEADGGLAGFSTFTLRPSRDAEGRSASVLCSGDTIVDPRHWGSSALGRTLIASAWDLHRSTGREAFWWLLITSGPRTWGVLPAFFKTFHPHPDEPMGPALREWLGRLCEERWPGRRSPGDGIVRLEHPQKLRPPLDAPPPARAGDRALAWYADANPGWRDGDELPSLVRIEPGNLTRAGWRYLSGYLAGLD